MPGVVTVARSRTGRDISNNGNLLSPVSSTHSRPLSHDSTHSGFVLKLKVNFSLELKYYSKNCSLFNRFNTPSGIFVYSHVKKK